jgi:uncharacterized protein YndB with AHSA1/START domain
VPKTHEGLLLIADITGYTGYLTASELEHAQGVLESLLGVLVDHTKPPLQISGFEGDAILSYTIPGLEVSPQTFLEMIETCYVSFRRQMELLVLNNTCGCNACANIGNLDLKFFVHWGGFTLQQLGNREELFGPDVILIHRLLKNRIREATGIKAYTVYTEAAANHLGLRSPELATHRESYEEFGEVALVVQNMHPAWEAAKDRATADLPKDAVFGDEIEIALTPATVWDYLARPEFRGILLGGFRVEVGERNPDGRLGEGASFVCYHGDREVKELILQWRPFERVVTRDQAMPGVTIIVACELTEVDGGTNFRMTLGDIEGPALKVMAMRLGLRMQKKQSHRDMANFKEAIESHYQQAVAAASPVS